MINISDYEAMSVALESSGNYRVLKRLKRHRIFNEAPADDKKTAIFLDLETTGLDPLSDEIIEFGMLAFSFSPDGRIFEIVKGFDKLNQPSKPIPEKIKELTGISDEMVAGCAIDPDEVEAFIEPAVLVIAHNAAFDRRFAERFSAAFISKPWACSMSQVPWEVEGFDGTRLKYLAAGCGFFFDGHRAIDDCFAGVEILARSLPKSGVIALGKLLEDARKPRLRLWADGAPYEQKDTLRSRGYRWNDGLDGGPRAWWVEIPEEGLAGEVEFLTREIYHRDVEIPSVQITAYERFSDRAIFPSPNSLVYER